MKDFANKLNSSPWRGCISEIGIGLEFSSRYLRIPGASKTILSVDCDYAGLERERDMRAVSLENVKSMAQFNYNKALQADDQDITYTSYPVFGLAISGAHYQYRDSHAWIYLCTANGDAYVHFTIDQSKNREQAGEWVAFVAEWLVSTCLLKECSWVESINRAKFFDAIKIDVLYAPGISDFERLLLLEKDNPLLYHDGKFRRVADFLRQGKSIYSGSFNPPHKGHLEVDAIFEISQKHEYKGDISFEDLLHRMRMLSAANKPVLITRCPRFIDKYRVIQAIHPTEEITFDIGADGWNATIAAHQYPTESWLGENMPNAKFKIRERNGVKIQSNNVSKYLKHVVVSSINPECSSTDIRQSVRNNPHLTLAVETYILNHGLYQ